MKLILKKEEKVGIRKEKKDDRWNKIIFWNLNPDLNIGFYNSILKSCKWILLPFSFNQKLNHWLNSNLEPIVSQAAAKWKKDGMKKKNKRKRKTES